MTTVRIWIRRLAGPALLVAVVLFAVYSPRHGGEPAKQTASAAALVTARRLFADWQAGDRVAAGQVAEPSVVERLFDIGRFGWHPRPPDVCYRISLEIQCFASNGESIGFHLHRLDAGGRQLVEVDTSECESTAKGGVCYYIVDSGSG